MHNRATPIIEQVINQLSKSSAVAALVLVGSQVKENKFPPDKFSDVEIYVVAYDEKYQEAENEVQSIQKVFGDKVVLAYKNQWAGWSVLFKDLLRLELPVVKASDDTVFSRSTEQKIKILYQKPGFELKRSKKTTSNEIELTQEKIEHEIKDFWYMAVYAAQHIGRGEIWLARDAVRISMQKKIKHLLQEIYHKDTLALDRDQRIEFTWGQKELAILEQTSSAYNKKDVERAFWANIKYMEELLAKMGMGEKFFLEYKNKLMPEIKSILEIEI